MERQILLPNITQFSPSAVIISERTAEPGKCTPLYTSRAAWKGGGELEALTTLEKDTICPNGWTSPHVSLAVR